MAINRSRAGEGELVEALDEATRARLQRQRRRDTAPELAVRSALHRAGLRFRVDTKPLADQRFRADIAFTRAKVAVFIDGCFWHGCPTHSTTPKHNRDWWVAKIDSNRERDQRIDATLRERGWAVLRHWEHEDPLEVSASIASVVAARRGPARSREAQRSSSNDAT